MAGDGWHGQDAYGNDMEYEGGRYARGAGAARGALRAPPIEYAESRFEVGGGRDRGFEERVHSTLFARRRRLAPLSSQDDSTGYTPKARDARGHRVDYNDDELSYASPFNDTGAAARQASLHEGLYLNDSERPRTAEGNHPPIGYMHQCMQLACLMGDVKEVERVAGIEGYNLEHLILGKRPMHLAAVANQPEVVIALAKAGAKLNGSDGTSNRSKPIHICAEGGCVEAADALVKLGARSETRPGDGLGPLHIACKHNHPEIIAVLLRAGANPDAVSREGTARDIAEMYHCTRCVDAIDDYIIDRHDDKKLASFHKMSIASPARHLGAHLTPPATPARKRVSFKDQVHSDRDAILIETAMLDLEMQCVTKPLASMQAACMTGDHKKVKKLLARGANCNAMCNARRPLHCAVLGDSVEVVLLLLAQTDIDVNGRDGEAFQTPLHVACDIACDPNIVLVLAKHKGVRIDATDALFRRPLHRAAEEGDEMACRLLVSLGADARAKDTTGQRPRDYSKHHGYTRLSGILAKAEAAAVRKKNAKRRTMAMAKMKHVSSRHMSDDVSVSTMGSRSVRSRTQKTHFPPAAEARPVATPPAGGRYRERDEVIDDLESVLTEVRSQPHGHLKVDSLVSRASRAVHASTPDTGSWTQKRGSASKARSPDVQGMSLDERFQQYEDSPPQTAEAPLFQEDDGYDGDHGEPAVGPPAEMEYDWRVPPKTPATPATDSQNVSSLLVPPDDEEWRSDLIPEPPTSAPKKKKRRKRSTAFDGDNTPPGSERRRRKYMPPLHGKSPAVDTAKFYRGDSGDEASTAFAVCGVKGPGYDGDYGDDELDEGYPWEQIEVIPGLDGLDLEEEESVVPPASPEKLGDAFSTYHRVHVDVSPVKTQSSIAFGSNTSRLE